MNYIKIFPNIISPEETQNFFILMFFFNLTTKIKSARNFQFNSKKTCKDMQKNIIKNNGAMFSQKK